MMSSFASPIDQKEVGHRSIFAQKRINATAILQKENLPDGRSFSSVDLGLNNLFVLFREEEGDEEDDAGNHNQGANDVAHDFVVELLGDKG